LISWVARGQYHKQRGVLLLMALFTVISACGDKGNKSSGQGKGKS